MLQRRNCCMYPKYIQTTIYTMHAPLLRAKLLACFGRGGGGIILVWSVWDRKVSPTSLHASYKKQSPKLRSRYLATPFPLPSPPPGVEDK